MRQNPLFKLFFRFDFSYKSAITALQNRIILIRFCILLIWFQNYCTQIVPNIHFTTFCIHYIFFNFSHKLETSSSVLSSSKRKCFNTSNLAIRFISLRVPSEEACLYFLNKSYKFLSSKDKSNVTFSSFLNLSYISTNA